MMDLVCGLIPQVYKEDKEKKGFACQNNTCSKDDHTIICWRNWIYTAVPLIDEETIVMRDAPSLSEVSEPSNLSEGKILSE